MKRITPFLWFDGKAGEAMKFYMSIFKDSKIVEVMRKDKQLGATIFRLNGQEFIALNGGPQFKFTPAVSFFVSCKTQREVDNLWEKLVEISDFPICSLDGSRAIRHGNSADETRQRSGGIASPRHRLCQRETRARSN